MTLLFRPISDVGPDSWDRMARSSPEGWVFGLFGWQTLVADVEPWGFVNRGFGIEENGRLVAVVPLHVRPQHKTAGSSGWGGCGPMIDAGLDEIARKRIFRAAVDHCLEVARDCGAERFEVSTSPVTAASIGNRWAVNPFVLEGLVDRSLVSQVVRLDVEETQLWQDLSKTARNLVRRAEKAGYRVEPADWLRSVDSYYDVHVETYTRTGTTPHPKSYFDGIARHVAPAGASRLLALISPGGEPVAFHNTAQFGIGANYHTGCSRTAIQADSAGYLLMWEALRAARAEGFTWYDCGWIFPGAPDPKQQGLTLFKTRFGGEPHRAFRAEATIVRTRDDSPAEVDVSAVGAGGPVRSVLGRVARVLTGRRRA